MDERQTLAHSNPLARADMPMGTLDPLTVDRRHATGVWVRTILAVDR